MPRHSPYALIRLNFLLLSSLDIFSWIAWVSWTFFRFVNSCEKVLSFCSWISFSTFRWNCNFTQIGKTYNFFANLVKNYLSSYLFVSYSSILFIRFSMNINTNTQFVRFLLSSHRVGIFDFSVTTPSFGCGNMPLVGSNLESLSNVPRLICFTLKRFGLIPCELCSLGGLKWTRTTDLALIRRAL